MSPKTITSAIAILLTAGPTLADNPIGQVDGFNRNWISGWACDPDEPETSVQIHIWAHPEGLDGRGYPIVASNPSEQAVNDSCGGGSAHRFHFDIQDYVDHYGDGWMYFSVWAINVSDGENLLLHSGTICLRACVRDFTPRQLTKVSVEQGASVAYLHFDFPLGLSDDSCGVEDPNRLALNIATESGRTSLSIATTALLSGAQVSGSFWDDSCLLSAGTVDAADVVLLAPPAVQE